MKEKVIDAIAACGFLGLMLTLVYHAANGTRPSLFTTWIITFGAAVYYTIASHSASEIKQLHMEREVIEDELAIKDQEIMRLRYLLDKQKREGKL